MSSSIRRSSKEEMEDTDEMLREPLTKTEQDNEYTVSDSDELEDTDEKNNHYMYDGFVVPDGEEDGTDELMPEDTESRRRRKKLRRKKQKDYSLDKDDTDLLEENLGTSTDKFLRLKKNRKHETEDDDILDDEDASLSSSYQKERKIQSYDDLKLINQIFHNDTEGEDVDNRMMIEDDNDTGIERRNELRGYFNPEEIEDHYQTEKDRTIVEKDEPERLQIRFANRPIPDNPELIEETNWLVEKIVLKNNLQSKDTVNLKNKVNKVLEFMRLANCEVMFIWVHKKHEIISDKKGEFEEKGGEYDLKLSDLWYIYDLDLEWMQIHQKRKHIAALIAKLDGYAPVGSNVKNSFRSCYDLTLLNFYLNYVEYQLRKSIDDMEIGLLLAGEGGEYESREPTLKRMKKRNFAREAIKHNLHEVAAQVSITPDHMAENLIIGEQKFKPKILNDTPDAIAHEYSNPSVPMIQMPVDTLTTLCDFMALELFHHPIIRKMLKIMYNEKVSVHTDPTEKGKKEISVYNFYYPVKRIRGLKPAAFNKELWLMVLEAEQKGLIKVSFKLPWDRDEKKDEVRKKLLNLYLLEIKSRKSEGHEIDTVNAWNIVREETISKLLKVYVYPTLEQTLREELKEISEKFVINECAKYFRDTINIQPYRKSRDDGDNPNEQSRIKVLSCISEPASAKCYFMMVDENGEMMEYLVLDYIGRNPGEDPSLKAIYQQERAKLKSLMSRIFPDVIVVGATNLNCQQIKLELDNISNEVLVDLNKKVSNVMLTKPFVMWGISSVPSAWAKSFQARSRYGELQQELREALSMCRMVQDPLVESLNLWGEKIKDNILLSLNYHVMQHMVSAGKLKAEFEKIAMEVCNNVGVEINRVVKYPHLSSPLQFICGLGPRKASFLIDRIAHDIGSVKMRRDLFDTCMQKTVYINCIGFIRIIEEGGMSHEDEGIQLYDKLDSTRIHPDFYQITVKIAKEAFEDHANERTDYVKRVMENPKKLNDLDLEDYAKHLNQKGRNNMKPLIEFIVQELTHPFQDPRAEFKTKLRSEDLFYKLTKESKYSLREEAIITVRITRIDGKAVRVVTDSGVPGIIPLQDLKDKVTNIEDGEISKFYSVGEYLKAKVRNINFNLVRLKLSTKPEDLSAHAQFARSAKVLEVFGLMENSTFLVDKTQDYPTLALDRVKKTSKYTPRRINHPKFKNIPLNTAVEYLQDREIGDFVIRPSSQGTDHLNITWKLSAENIVHLDILEGYKGVNDMISKNLTLDKETYESLDEIIERYIKPCNNIVSQIREHKKFMDNPLEFLSETLIEEKKNDQNFIPYYTTFIPEAPQYLILAYIPRFYDVQYEYIKIKPDGLMFHDIKFSSIKKLVSWFKNQLKTPEYQKYLEHMVPPPFDVNRSRTKVKEEFGVKREMRDTKREKKREKDSVYKRPVDNVKRRRMDRDPDQENRYRRAGSGGWNQNEWDDEGGYDNRDWNQDWNPKASRDKEGGRSRSRSISKDRNSKREDRRVQGAGKKSVASKHSFTSEYLHNAWGSNNVHEETWDRLETDQNDGWAAKSEIKTENEWGTGQQNKTENDWGNWNENKTYRTNDQESNW